jgi:hypothetical protein
LMQIDYNANPAILSEPEFVESSRALVKQFASLKSDAVSVSTSHPTQVRRVARTRNPIIHTSQATGAAQDAASPQTQLIELKFRPTPTSAQRLRAAFAELVDQRSVAKRAVGAASRK